MKVFTVVGARPQFIKAAAVSRAFAAQEDISELLIHTGQHYDANMSDVFFAELGIPDPHLHLGIGGGTHGEMTGKMLSALEAAMIAERPGAVLIYGDTNSTLAAALAAVKLHIPVFHVEAGLRSFNRKMPEEINRVMADHVSELLFCPTQIAVDNLEREGILDGVSLVGDVMFDATLYAQERSVLMSTIVDDLGLEGERFAVATLHRAENTDDPARLDRILDELSSLSKDLRIVFPVHPRTRKIFAERGIRLDNITQIDPLGYFDLHRLLGACELVITDSGGLQKEAYFHSKPCITMRDETEWVELIEAGWNRLWTSEDWAHPRREISDYGTGKAAEAIVTAIRDWFKSGRN